MAHYEQILVLDQEEKNEIRLIMALIKNIEGKLDRAVKIVSERMQYQAKQIYQTKMRKLQNEMLEETGFDVQYELREEEYSEACFPAAIFYMDKFNFYIDLRHDL